jgi:hypothetical protein
MKAHCQCGQLAAALPATAPRVIACHCTFCQRRSGSPFGVLAYYPADQVVLSGEAKRYERPTDAGGVFETFFCPTCGSTVYARASLHPGVIGIAVGAIADPAFPAPVLSGWEETRHRWVSIPGPIPHLPRGHA